MDATMRNLRRNVAFLLLLALVLPGPQAANAAQWVSVGGNVYFGATPLCALVLVNGQTQFSCDGTGRYDMQVPVDENGMITVMSFADGFAPFNQILPPEQATEFQIDMLLDQQSPTLAVYASAAPAVNAGWFVVSGVVVSGSRPICALVLANGKTLFSCAGSLGQFSLDVPVDLDGNITLMIFATGFKPYKQIILADPDTDGDGVKDRLDEDDDNDGLFDGDDVCPLQLDANCVEPITDTVLVQGREWAQVDLFANLTWSDINAVCPEGLCVHGGVLNGKDMTGWTWASADDLNGLINFYLGTPELGPGPDVFSEIEAAWSELFGEMTRAFRFTNFQLPWTYYVLGWLSGVSANDAPIGSCPYGAAGVSTYYENRFMLVSWFRAASSGAEACDVSTADYGAWFYRDP
jgi:hypothetical protein